MNSCKLRQKRNDKIVITNKENCINTYPMGATSRKMNFSLSRVTNSSSRPTYTHIIALVGRIAQANAAAAKLHFLETKGTLVEETLIQGQWYRLTSVRTVSKLFDNVRGKQNIINQFANCEKSCNKVKYAFHHQCPNLYNSTHI